MPPFMCWRHGHVVKKVDGEKKNLVYQKGDVRQVIEYFSGTYEYCEREGCDWTHYTGTRIPYRRDVMGEKNWEDL